MSRYEVCPVDELPPGSMKIVPAGATLVGVYNCGGEYFALEDRCSHDDGPLVEGEWEPDRCTVICPRHGSHFDLRTGRPLSLPAYEPVATYGVTAEDGTIYVDVPDQMLDDRVRAVAEDTPLGRFLFALVAPQSDCGVLEVGPVATIWLAAGVRTFSGRVVTVGADAELRRKVAEAGLDEWVVFAESLDEVDDVFDVVVIASGESVSPRVRELVEPAALIVSASPLDDPALLSVEVPVGPGLHLSVVLE